MTDPRKVTLQSQFDATGVRKGTQEAKDAVRDLARDVQQSTAQDGKAVGGIGEGAAGAGEKVDRATKNIAASIERATAAAKAGERGTASFFETLARQRGANLGALQPYLDQLRQVEAAQRQAAGSLGAMGVSANQTRAALRQLPAQFTDIFTSLSSGQAPLTVLIQQGGQIKDSFGGIGNALRGVASAISPMAIALGAGGAAAAALALAFKAGSDEATEYRKALVLTGNAAGSTVGQLQATAEAVARNVGTQSQAATVLAQLAATGQVAGGSFDKMAEAAIRLERVGGPAVEKTVQAFADLGKDPLQASIKLNEQTNFLTVGLYKQIKALDEQGKTAEAAAVAQRAFYEAGNSRAKELEANLGSIERGWLAVKDAVSSAKDALLSIGRQDTPQQQLSRAEAELAQLQQSRTVGRNAGRRQTTFDAEEAAIKQRIEAARFLVLQEGEVAAAQQARAEGVKAVIKADKDAAMSSRARAEGLTQEQLAAKAYADVITDLQRVQAESVASALGYSKAQQRILAYFQSAEFKNASPEMRKQAVAEFEAARAAEQAADARKELQRATEETLKAQAKWLEGIDKSIEGAEKEAEALREQIVEITLGKAAREALVQGRLDDAAAQAKQNAQQAIADGLLESEYGKLVRLAGQLQQVADLRRQLTTATAQREVDDANAKAAQAAANDWRTALTDAFRRSFEAGGDIGKNFAKIIGNELKARLSAALAEALTAQVLGTFGLQVAGGGSAGGMGGGANLLQLGSNASSLYSAYNGTGLWGTAAAAGNYASVYSGAAYGTGFGTQQSAMLAAQEAGMVSQAGGSAMSGLGAYAGYAALIYAAYQQGSADYDAGFRRNQSKDSGTALGDASYRTADLFSRLGLSDKWADLISGATLTARLFGRSEFRLDQQGISGTLGQGGFAGEQFALFKAKGGLFRSDDLKGQYGAVDDTLNRFLNDGARGVLTAAENYGKALGLPVESLAKVNTDLRIVWTEDGEENLKAIQEAFAKYGQELVAGYTDAIKPLANFGETTAQTIARVSGAITGVNDVLESLGVAALRASVEGGQAAVALQETFGGLQGLQQLAGGYLQAYYTEAERAALTTDALTKTLQNVGLALPATRDGFRALVEAQDLNTESGRKAFAALMGVADAFASVSEAARTAADIAAERAQLQDQLDQLAGNDAAIKARERAKIDASNLGLYDQLQALTQAQKDAAAAAQAATAAEEQRAAELLRQQDAAYAASQAWQATQDAASQAAAEAQAAWKAARDSIRTERDRILGIVNPNGSGGANAARFGAVTNAARGGDLAAAQLLPEVARAYVDGLDEVAKSAAELRIMRLRVVASLTTTDLLLGGKVPGFADGGWHGGGARWVGERAPELEVTGPSRIYSYEQLMTAAGDAAAGGAATANELRALRDDMARERQATQAALLAIAQHTSLSAAVLDEAARGKRALSTEAVA